MLLQVLVAHEVVGLDEKVFLQGPASEFVAQTRDYRVLGGLGTDNVGEEARHRLVLLQSAHDITVCPQLVADVPEPLEHGPLKIARGGALGWRLVDRDGPLPGTESRYDPDAAQHADARIALPPPVESDKPRVSAGAARPDPVHVPNERGPAVDIARVA